MLSKCLNPHCSKTFHHFGQGRLFRIDFSEAGRRNALAGKPVVSTIRSKANPIEHFWLCEDCSTTLTIELSEAGEVRLTALETVRKPVAMPTPQIDRSRKAAVS